MMKTPFKIVICIVSFFIASASFGQNISSADKALDTEITQRLKQRGFSDEQITAEISHLKPIIIQKEIPSVPKNPQNRSIQAIPASERAALVNLYNTMGGPGWNYIWSGIPWDINNAASDVATWSGVQVIADHVVGIRVNNVSGSIPNLGDLTQLKTLGLTGNITGNVSGILTLGNLKNLYIYSTGSIDSFTPLSTMVGLEDLYLNTPVVDHVLPSQFVNLVNLKNILIYQSDGLISGNLNILGSMPNLKTITMRGNYTGALPSNFSNLQHLERIEFSSCHITDISVLGSIPTLQAIWFVNNDLTAMPSNLQNLTNLRELELSTNEITGTVPAYFSNFNFWIFDVSHNELEGSIPAITHSNDPYVIYTTFQQQLFGKVFNIDYNKFRFKDFANEFTYYKTNWTGGTSQIYYQHQAKTDLPITQSVAAGGSITFKMSDDELSGQTRYTNDDTFQWFKNGVPVGTSRIFSKSGSSLTTADSGIYTCFSYHQMNPDMSPMVLERNTINLTVTAAPVATPLGSCAEGFEGETFPPAGWMVTDNRTNNGNQWQISGLSNSAHSGVKGAGIMRENTGNGVLAEEWLIAPRTMIPTNAQLRFFTRQVTQGQSVPPPGTLYEIRISPFIDQGDLNAYTTIRTYTESELSVLTNTHLDFEEKKVDLPNIAWGIECYVAFVKVYTQVGPATGGDGWLIDDVSMVQECVTPTSVTALSATYNSAVLGWTSTGAAQYQVEYGPSGFVQGTGTLITVNTNSASLTGLTPYTHYQFYVKGICSPASPGCFANDSDWSQTSYFVTSYYCLEATNITVTNYTGTSATVSWSAQNGNVTAWEVWVFPSTPSGYQTTNSPGTIVTGTTYNVTGLINDIQYVFAIRAICGEQTSVIMTQPITNAGQTTSCVKSNPENATQIKQKVLALINELIGIANSGGTVTPSYNSAAFQALVPYLTDASPAIYNFSYTNSKIKFSFAPHSGASMKDIEIDYNSSYGLMTNFNYESFSSPQYYLYETIANFQNGQDAKMSMKHIDFCKSVTIDPCVKTNPRSETVKAKFIDLVNHLHQQLSLGVTIPSGYNCPQLDALRPYLTDPNARIYNVIANPFSFSFHPNGPNDKWDVAIKDWALVPSLLVTDINSLDAFQDPTVYTILNNQVIIPGIGNPKSVTVRHVNFCPPPTEEPTCQIHFDFNFKVPVKSKGGLFTSPQKENIAKGIVNFVNSKIGEELYITTFDDYSGGIRKTALQTKFLSALPSPTSNLLETSVPTLLRIQHSFNTNTFQSFITAANGIVNNPLITKQIDVAFFVISNDRYTNINTAKAAYNALLASTIVDGGVVKPRVKKIFFIVFNEGRFIKSGTPPKTAIQFITELRSGNTPADFETNGGNIFTSDYVQFSKETVASNEFPDKFQDFLKRAYDSAKKDCDSESCTNKNPRSYTVKVKFLELVNRLHEIVNNGGTIPNGFSCPELVALKPYITDKNPRIYNFQKTPFSFSFHKIKKDNEYDVKINLWDYTGDDTVATVSNLDISSYVEPNEFTLLHGKALLSNGLIPEQTEVRHVNFCPGEGEISCTVDNENSEIVSEYFMDLMQYIINQKLNGLSDADITNNMNGASPIVLNNLRPFLTDPNSGIYNFTTSYNGDTLNGIQFSFSQDHEVDVQMYGDFLEIANIDLSIDLSSYNDPNEYLDLSGDYTDQSESGNKINFSKFVLRHINFCPGSVLSCTATNPRSARVKSLFINLVNKLRAEFLATGNIPDGFGAGVPELTLLTPYITDPDPRIYNFSQEPFSFSFHPVSKETGTYDVLISKSPMGIANVATIGSMSSYTDPDHYTDLGGLMTLANGYQPDDVQVRHINFCPDNFCVNHVAIVLDESGSLDELEKIKIRRQLNDFVKRQAQFNTDTGGQMHVSLIGMSDKDSDGGRTDHVIQQLVTPASVGTGSSAVFTNWIANYGARYNAGINGVSPSSDYWNSALEVALDSQMPPDLVIMITDGSESADIDHLVRTMSKFENSRFDDLPKDASKPHLYVIGIDDGFYVYGESTNILPRAQDPNYNPNLEAAPGSRRTLASSLALSLKHLFQLDEAVFPTEDEKHFMAVSPFTDPNPDYYGHANFAILGADATYIADRIKRADIGCGKEDVKDPCDDCYSFQPEPGKTYVLNAWVKEELNIQVQNYDNPKIRLIFKNLSETVIGDKIFETKGDIIEGWQRIGDKFEIPYDPLDATNQTVYVEFELINSSNSVPVFFDDIRIYPIKGSMKTFVYDPETFRLMSELDENNYSTYYEYDNEGGLVRVKKETATGIKTIQETRSGNYIKRD